MTRKWFTADPHFDHQGIMQMCARPFHDVRQMNEFLIEEINERVQKHDVLYMLGDFGWAGGGAAEKHRRAINCKTIHFIRGNHDRPAFDDLFTTASDTKLIKVQGHKTWLSHYPHAIWPHSHNGGLHLYGHTHWQREAYLDDALRDTSLTMVVSPHRRSLDVGVDSAFQHLGTYRPFSEDEVLEILLQRKGHHNVSVERYIEDGLHGRR